MIIGLNKDKAVRKNSRKKVLLTNTNIIYIMNIEKDYRIDGWFHLWVNKKVTASLEDGGYFFAFTKAIINGVMMPNIISTSDKISKSLISVSSYA